MAMAITRSQDKWLKRLSRLLAIRQSSPNNVRKGFEPGNRSKTMLRYRSHPLRTKASTITPMANIIPRNSKTILMALSLKDSYPLLLKFQRANTARFWDLPTLKFPVLDLAIRNRRMAAPDCRQLKKKSVATICLQHLFLYRRRKLPVLMDSTFRCWEL